MPMCHFEVGAIGDKFISPVFAGNDSAHTRGLTKRMAFRSNRNPSTFPMDDKEFDKEFDKECERVME